MGWEDEEFVLGLVKLQMSITHIRGDGKKSFGYMYEAVNSQS